MEEYLKRLLSKANHSLLFELTKEELDKIELLLDNPSDKYIDICINFNDLDKILPLIENNRDSGYLHDIYRVYLFYSILSNKKLDKYLSNSIKKKLSFAEEYLFNSKGLDTYISLDNYDLEGINRKIRNDNLELRLHFMVDNLKNEKGLQEHINEIIGNRVINVSCYTQEDSLITDSIFNDYHIIEYCHDYNTPNINEYRNTYKKVLKM